MISGRFRVILSPRAFADLDRILDYIAKDSPMNAARFIDHLQAEMDGLADLPYRYPIHQETRRRAPVRRMPVPPYLVYYRVIDAHRAIRVLMVRHGARRQPKRFPA
jgi:toxin ParE1/3/4